MTNIAPDCVNHPDAPWNELPIWTCQECGVNTAEDEILCDDCYKEEDDEEND